MSLDVTRLTPAGPTTDHVSGAVSTDGPWLICYGPTQGDSLVLLVPAHAVVAVEVCSGTDACRATGRGAQ